MAIVTQKIVHTTAHYVNFIVVEQVQARPGDTAAGIHYTSENQTSLYPPQQYYAYRHYYSAWSV